MKLSKIFCAVALAGAFSAPAFAVTNVALGANVVINGSGFGNSGGWCCGSLQPSSIVNGTPQADGTQWNVGTAFWTGSGSGDTADTITINLAHTSSVSGIVLQADDNDTYNISYWGGSSWVNLATVGTYGSWGLVTRPEISFGSITTNAFQITGNSGDGYYAVGQFEAFGAPVPEPTESALILTGIGLLGFIAARRKKSA
jgi:hypothetical protein